MSEPEEILIEAAHRATVQSLALWRRVRPAPTGAPGLDELAGRLAMFLDAICPGAPPIVPAEPPATPSWLGRIARPSPPHLVERRALASTDGARLRLPPRLELDPALVPGAYRILALGQALRARRGTMRALPVDAAPWIRDLYAFAENAAVESELALLAPGLVPELERLKRVEVARRPPRTALSAAEGVVEDFVGAHLAAGAGAELPDVPRSSTPEDSLAWARDVAHARIAIGSTYRGVAAVALWGRVDPAAPASGSVEVAGDPGGAAPVPPGRTGALVRRPRIREAPPGEDDEGRGIWMTPTSDRQESVEDPMGLTRPTDRDDDADPGDLADSLAELPEARLVTTPGTPREILMSGDPPSTRARRAPGGSASGRAIAYPEWDWRTASYLPERALVRLVPPPEGSTAWADEVLRRHAPLIHQTRRRFERLRPRRVRLTRQLDGAEVDLEACVEAHADARAGRPATDRLYVAERPLRRGLALLILVDASASTDAWVDGTRRIIDVEKEALLVLCEGLEVLGDRYAILSFSGEGPEAVRVANLKDFGSRHDAAVRRRISGLEPERYTRLGAAVRHATGVLATEHGPHRLLLVLSDGKPNDVDEYEGRYGIEDSRQAILEAHAVGVHPFCLTVDRHAASYLPRIFGPSGHSVVRHVQALPGALLDAVRRLVR